jgi:hypothetical protein
VNVHRGDTLDFDVSTPSITATYTTGTGTLVLSATAGMAPKFADFQAIARSLHFSSSARRPNTEDRRVAFIASDGTKSSPSVPQTTITVCAAQGYFAEQTSLRATLCPQGKYQPSSCGTQCAGCAQGKHAAAPSTYTAPAVLEAASCTGCAAGRYQTAVGQVSCVACGTGKYGSAGIAKNTAAHCVDCVAGTYQLATAQTSCTNCEAGKYADAPGSALCQAFACCSAGHARAETSPSSGGTCAVCMPGTFKAEGAQCLAACAQCAAGKFGDNQQSTSVATYCVDCATGRYESQTGTHSDAASSCTACAAGTHQSLEGKTSCDGCADGTYQTATGQASCDACAAGKYGRANSDQNESAYCTTCAAGKYNEITGKHDNNETPCSDCPAGKHAAVLGSTGREEQHCVACEAGKYQDAVEFALECKSCALGSSFQTATGQLECLGCTTAACPATQYTSATCTYDEDRQCRDRPVMTGVAGTVFFVEGVDPASTDAINLAAIPKIAFGASIDVVRVTLSNYEANDVLISGHSSASVASDGKSLALANTGTLADYEAAMAAITFRNTGHMKDQAVRTVRVTYRACHSAVLGETCSDDVSMDIALTPTTDQPTVAVQDASQQYTQDGAALTFASSVTLADKDNSKLQSATVTVAGAQADDELSCAAIAPLGSAISFTVNHAAPSWGAHAGGSEAGSAYPFSSIFHRGSGRGCWLAPDSPAPRPDYYFILDVGSIRDVGALQISNCDGWSTAYRTETLSWSLADTADGHATFKSFTFPSPRDGDDHTIAINGRGRFIRVNFVAWGGNSPALNQVKVLGAADYGITAQSSTNGANAVCTLSGAGTVAQYTSAIRALTFSTTSLSTAARAVSIVVTDASGVTSQSAPIVNIGICAKPGFISALGASTLQACAAGTYTAGMCASECTNCAAGTFGSGATTSAAHCVKCDQGQYQSNVAAVTCEHCTAGHYGASGTGATSSAHCLPCADGTYQEGTGAKSCTKCSAGTSRSSASRTDSDHCENCVTGKYQHQDGQASCVSCAAGKYGLREGDARNEPEACRTCGVASYAPTEGMTECLSWTCCSAGQVVSGGSTTTPGACTSCGAGRFQPTDNQCAKTECDSWGSMCQNGYERVGADATQTTACTACAAGQFRTADSSNPHATCATCAAGEVAGSASATCTACGHATFADDAQATCTACGAETHGDSTVSKATSAHCKPCQAWHPWGTCSKSCGGGSQTRTRVHTVTSVQGEAGVCNDEMQTQSCNTNACQERSHCVYLKCRYKKTANGHFAIQVYHHRNEAQRVHHCKLYEGLPGTAPQCHCYCHRKNEALPAGGSEQCGANQYQVAHAPSTPSMNKGVECRACPNGQYQDATAHHFTQCNSLIV